MYASNEDEDWIYLHRTPPVNTVLQGAMNLVDYERSYSSSSNSSSSSSDRSVSLSSISSTELEHAQNDDITMNTDDSINHHDLEQENRLLETINIEDPFLFSYETMTQTDHDNNLLVSPQLISTPTEKEKEILPSEIMTNDILNTGFELSQTFSLTNSNESLSLPDDLRHRNVQQTDLYNSEVIQSTPISQDIKPRKHFEHPQNNNNTLVSCTCLIILLTLSFILGQTVTQWDQPVINQIATELVKTNRRLNEIGHISIGNFEERLTKQFEEKIQNMINQQMTWHEHEKFVFISQIRELRETLNITQHNLTNTIHQLTNENGRLQEQIKSLERRLDGTEEQYLKDKETCVEGVNCTKSSTSTLGKLVTNLFKRTVSIATSSSVNLSGLFEHLSASVSKIVDHRYEYVKQSKRKLTNLAGSSTAGKVQTTFRRSVENLSSSFRKAKLSYATWLKSRAQARMTNNAKTQQQTVKNFPWRWTFQHDYNQERVRYQTPNKEHVCYSKFYFPINKICSMRNWMVKLFRS